MPSKALVGTAGVHFVAFVLSSRGYAVALTSTGVKAVDLMAASPGTGKSIAIQVKTMRDAHMDSKKWGPFSKWRIGKELALGHASAGSNLLLTFVDLHGGPPATPDVFIVPLNALGPLNGSVSPAKPVEREGFPKGSPTPRDFWIDIYDKDAAKFQNRWDIVEGLLGPP